MRWALAFTLALSTAAVAQQAPPTGDGSILLTVVADTTGRPVKGANVIAIVFSSGATFSKSTITDRNGRALIFGLPEGRVRLSASHPAFVASILGQNSPSDNNGTYLTLKPGQHLVDITLRMKRGGAIGGIVADDTGEPVVGIDVGVYRRDYSRGRLQFIGMTSDVTDDRGAYRFSGLPPGTYVVGIIPLFAEQAITEVDPDADDFPTFVVSDDREVWLRSMSPPPLVIAGQMHSFAKTYYPGVRSLASATTITIDSAEQRDGFDFRVLSVRVTRLTGRLICPPGTTIDRGQLVLAPAVMEASTDVQFVAQTASDGRFGFPFVPFGDYTILARAETPNTSTTPDSGAVRTLWAALPVTVSDTATSVTVLLNEGMTFAGRVSVADTPARNTSAAWRVVLHPQNEITEVKSYAGNLSNDGQFMISGLPPDIYSVTISGAPVSGPYIASVMVDGRDVLDFGLKIEPGHDIDNATIVLRNTLAEVSGTLRDQQDAPTTLGSVVLFASDSRYWTGNSRRVIAQRPDVTGHFQLRLLPPGDYLLAAADVSQGQAQDPAFLEALRPQASSITLAEGEKKSIDVRRR